MAKQEIVEAIVKSNIGEVADGLDKAKKSTKELADSTKDADKGFGRVGKAVKGIGTALKAAGITFDAMTPPSVTAKMFGFEGEFISNSVPPPPPITVDAETISLES